MAKKIKQVAGVDYESFSWADYIGGQYSYVDRFEQADAMNILYRGVFDRRITRAIKAGRIAVDDLNGGNVQSSFYGKARIAHIESKTGRVYEVLISYNTAVCMIDNSGRFIRLWNGWSATTAKHVKRFFNRYGLSGVSKAEWLDMPIGKPSGIAID